MAKTKAELIKQAQAAGIDAKPSQTIKQIEELIKQAPAEPVKEAKPEPKSPVAKAGKRSAKATQEAEAKEAKKSRPATATPKPKLAVKPPRSRLERRGKNYRQSAKQIDPLKSYTIEEAAKLAKQTSTVKFDATVELHVNLGIDPKQADQNVRASLVLPAGSGRAVRVAALTANAAAATKAGADLAGEDDLLDQIGKEKLDFDILITEPAMMPKLGRFARLLGPKGLMPNPKSGTVTTGLPKAIGEAKAGRVEFRSDSSGIIHLGIGKVSFSESNLADNMRAVLDNLKANKPASVKGAYIRAVHLTTSMGPSIKVDLTSI